MIRILLLFHVLSLIRADCDIDSGSPGKVQVGTATTGLTEINIGAASPTYLQYKLVQSTNTATWSPTGIAEVCAGAFTQTTVTGVVTGTTSYKTKTDTPTDSCYYQTTQLGVSMRCERLSPTVPTTAYIEAYNFISGAVAIVAGLGEIQLGSASVTVNTPTTNELGSTTGGPTHSAAILSGSSGCTVTPTTGTCVAPTTMVSGASPTSRCTQTTTTNTCISPTAVVLQTAGPTGAKITVNANEVFVDAPTTGPSSVKVGTTGTTLGVYLQGTGLISLSSPANTLTSGSTTITTTPTTIGANSPTTLNLGTTTPTIIIGSSTGPAASADLRINNVYWQNWGNWEMVGTHVLAFDAYTSFPWVTCPTPTPIPTCTITPNLNSYKAPTPAQVEIVDCVTPTTPSSYCGAPQAPVASPATKSPTSAVYYRYTKGDCLKFNSPGAYRITVGFTMTDLTLYHIDAIKFSDCGNVAFTYTASPATTETVATSMTFIYRSPTPSPAPNIFFRMWGSGTTATFFGGLSYLIVEQIGIL